MDPKMHGYNTPIEIQWKKLFPNTGNPPQKKSWAKLPKLRRQKRITPAPLKPIHPPNSGPKQRVIHKKKFGEMGMLELQLIFLSENGATFPSKTSFNYGLFSFSDSWLLKWWSVNETHEYRIKLQPPVNRSKKEVCILQINKSINQKNNLPLLIPGLGS